jgi:Tfp pilus assembly protein PilF
MQPGGEREARDILVALVRDYPNFALAHALLAEIYVRLTSEDLGLPSFDTALAAERHLNEARRFGGETGEVAHTGAIVTFLVAKRFDAALAQAERATELSPGNWKTWQAKALILSVGGRDREALETIARARAVDPAQGQILWDPVFYLHVAGRNEEALAAMREAEVRTGPSHFFAALVYGALGRDAEAFRSWVARGRRNGLTPQEADRALRIGAEEGLSSGYAALLRMQRAGAYEEIGVQLAILRLKAGDRAGAVRALAEAPPPRKHYVILFADRLPVLAPLRGDPRLSQMFAEIEEYRT